MARSVLSPQRSGSSTPVLIPANTSNEERQYVRNNKRPQLRKNHHSGTSVSFVGEEAEDEHTNIRSPISPPIAYHNSKSQSFSSSKVKLKPLLSKKSLDTPAIDLSKSMAENEGLGIFTQPQRIVHTRTSSGVSAVTTNSVNTRPGAQYRNDYTHTPPISRQRSRAQSTEDLHASSATHYKSSRTPPPLHIRTHSSSSNPRVRSASQTHLDNPQSASSIYREPFSPESMARSGRSSMDSVWRRRRANTDEDPVAAAAAVREEWFARQEAKRRKREEEEARNQDRIERRQDRMNAITRRNDEQKRSRAGTMNTLATSEKDSMIGSIRYHETKPGLPVDKELEYIRAGIRPPRERAQTSSTLRKKVRGTKNAFEKFFYDLYTVWLKLLNVTGIKKAS